MSTVNFRFYAELNDFLPSDHRQVEFSLSFNPSVTVKHLIESLGVPHTEVDLILVNGEPVGFDYQVKDDDRISVYPVFEALNIASLDHLHPQPLRNPALCWILTSDDWQPIYGCWDLIPSTAMIIQINSWRVFQ